MQPASCRTDSAQTHRTTSSVPHGHTHVPSWHRHWHRKASIVTQTLLPQDDHPTPAVHLRNPPLHRHRQQLHCPTHKCTLGNAATLSCDVPKAVHKLHRLLADVPARLNRKQHKVAANACVLTCAQVHLRQDIIWYSVWPWSHENSPTQHCKMISL